MHTTNDATSATPTVRVVFDGPPFAGKTTAARSLSELLGGTVVTPDEADGRTLWFDWMAYDAGHHAGQPIRVEIVTVPGQRELSDRRRHLLGWGDVIVFVANTSEAVFADSVTSYNQLREELATRPETPIVVLANKRDLIDAVAMPEVVSQLALGSHDCVIEGIALQGGGIREAFMHAVHAVLEQPERRLDATTADALLDELQAAVAQTEPEPEAQPEPATAESVSEETQPEPAAAETQPEPEELLPAGLTVELRRPALNPDAIAEGGAIAILAEHWQMLVDVAKGSGPLPRTDDPAEAVVIAELAAWGLLVEGDPAPAEEPLPDADRAGSQQDEFVVPAPLTPTAPEPTALAPTAAASHIPSVASIEASEAPAVIRF